MRKGQFSLEYAFVIVACVGAIVAMTVFITRAISGKWRESVDTIGFNQQYDPYATTVR